MQLGPLLQTKLYIPRVRPERVSRPRLIERLNQGLGQSQGLGQNQGFGRRLTLVSAPAGFGKTTLVSEWVASCQRLEPKVRAAWLSLDERDNDSTRFLTYLIAALQTIAAQQSPVGSFGEGVLGLLQSPQPPPTESILTALLNEVTITLDDFILVLDDYHLIDAEPVDASTSVDGALTFLLENLPPQMHLVIATREDPNLPLARLRVRDQLTELRITDLRFTPSEAAAFFNQVMGLNLSPEQVASLETRTEGWIAGLQLAALALQGTLASQGTLSEGGRDDVSGFIRAFAGDNRYVVDYLVDEVLQRQPEHVRSFLLQTSILDRLSGPLCDAVRFGKAEAPSTDRAGAVRFGKAEIADRSARAATNKADAVRFGKAEASAGQEEGHVLLAALERGNLFVVPLDDKRQWYRYHHLFADVLQTHLMEEQPHQVPALHRRASEWYEDSGSPADAVRHALAAEDFERVADLAEMVWQAMDDSFQSAAWLGWVGELPEELIRRRPVLSTQYASALWMVGELEASEARLRDAERWLDPSGDVSARPEPSAHGMVVVDEEQFRTLPAKIALARANIAQALGDFSASVKYAELAVKLTPEEDYLGRAQATATLGFTNWASGDLEAAHRAMADWVNSMQTFGNMVFAIASTFALADIMVAQGRLHDAVRAYQQSLQLASEQDEHVQRITAHLHLGLAMLHHEMGDQQAAAPHLQKCRELGERSALPDWPYRWHLAQARLKEAGGDLEAALDLLDEAKRLYVRVTVPDTHPIEALKARVYVKQGRLTNALAWVRERGLSVDDELGYLREFEHMTLARVLIAEHESTRAEGSVRQAIGLLERLLNAAQDSRRVGSVIEILVLQALAHQAQGDVPHSSGPLERALAPLERALTLAQPEGHVRIFVDEGPPMAALLREAAKRAITPSYVSQLRAAFGQAESRTPVNQHLIEPLTERELKVLELLGTELNGPEIARELVVSLNTMRTHTKNIYSKFGVNNRRAAVRRAEELDLL